MIREITQSPVAVLQRCSAEALLLCGAHSAGVSMLVDGDAWTFYVPAVVGPWATYTAARLPRACSPEGTVLERNEPQRFREPDRYYPFLKDRRPPAVEMLLVPLAIRDRSIGVLWILSHDDAHRFDAEDERRLRLLARCGAAAHAVASSLTGSSVTDDGSATLSVELLQLQYWLDSERARAASADRFRGRSLSRRQRDVCGLVARGYTNTEIATMIGVDEKTVATYRARVVDKLGFRNRADFVTYALEQGWLQA